MPIQLIPAPGWFAVLTTSDPPFYELSPLVGWLFRSDRHTFDLEGVVDGHFIRAAKHTRFLC